jgi:hypothetical protein
LQALGPGPELALLEGVVEAHHRHRVDHRGEQRDGRGRPHRARGRVGGDELGELLLDGPQRPDELVVLGVADDRVVELVVAPVVLGDLGAEPDRALLDLLVGHAPQCTDRP